MGGNIGPHFSAGRPVASGDGFTCYEPDLGSGRGTVTVYDLMESLEVVLVDFDASHYQSPIVKRPHVLVINHCLSGRYECEMHDGCLQYIGAGDVFISTLMNHSERIELPLGYYRGLTILVDCEKLAGDMDCLLPGYPLDIANVMSRLFKRCDCFMLQSTQAIQHIFARMYTAPEGVRPWLYRLKVSELLLFLDEPCLQSQKLSDVYTRQQVDRVKRIHGQITQNLGHRYTIEELSQQYAISATALKQHFKGIYGQPMAAYMKHYRIHAAVEMLREGDRTIAEIAHDVGYESQGKFTAAFRSVMGLTPTAYRKKP